MRETESLTISIRGLQYHVRRWVRPGGRKLILLHGWMDVSASFQFLVDELPAEWDVYAPDWRGFGMTQWGPAGHYTIADYLGDLDALLEQVSPTEPVDIVGHSMGANIAMLYAGARPARVARLVNLEGFGGPECLPEQAPERYAQWLRQLRSARRHRTYATFEILSERLRSLNPRLREDRAHFVARHWARETGDGRVVLRADPAHNVVSATLHRTEETLACWSRISAAVLYVEGGHSHTGTRLRLSEDEERRRREAMRRFTMACIPDAGHMLHHDSPEEVARLTERFLRCA